MCRPPDITPQGLEPVARDSAQYYGSGLEIEPDSFLNASGEWEHQVNEEFTPAQDDGSWDLFQNNTQAGSYPYVAKQQQQQHVGQQFDNQGNFGNPMAKLSRRPANSVFGFPNSGSFGFPDKNLWKQPQGNMGNGTPQNLMWNGGNSIPVAPPRPPYGSGIPNTPIASMMAGPSLTGPEFQPSHSWNKAEGSEVLDQLMKSALQGMKPQVANRPSSLQNPSLSQDFATQLKPWAGDLGADKMDSSLDDKILSDDDDEAVKDKKMRRMLSNRASAKRSRQRRQERLGELEIQTAKLRVENAALSRQYTEAMDQVKVVQKENASLKEELESVRAELSELKLQKSGGGMSSSSKQESGGKMSAHSAADRGQFKEGDNDLEAHSDEKVCENEDAQKYSAAAHQRKGCSPKSGITGEELNPKKELIDTSGDEEFGCLLDKDMEIATDEWFESLVQSLED